MADLPVTKENYTPFVVKRFQERVSLELTHKYLCRAIQKNLQNSGDKITALTPLNFATEDVPSNSDDVEEPAAKRPREANLEENLESIKSIDHIPCDPNVYEPPGTRSRTDSDPVQFEAVRTVFEIHATMLPNLFAHSPSDVMKLQDIRDIIFCRRISKEKCEKMEKIRLPITKLKVNIGMGCIKIALFDPKYGKDPMEITYEGKDYKTLAACDIFFLMKHPDLKLKKLAFRIAEHDRFIDVSVQKLIVKLLEQLEHKIHVEGLSYTCSTEELYIPNTVTNYLPEILQACQPETLKYIRLWGDGKTLDTGVYTRIKELNFEKVYETEQWKKADVFADHSDIPKDWANLVHFGTISCNSVDLNDLKNLLDHIPKKAKFEVVVDNMDIEDVLYAFRGHGKFGRDPDSLDFDFPFEFYRELGDGRVLVYEMTNSQFDVYFQKEEEERNLVLWA
ncbi:hypothetical protein B9Z55_012877 [Caenorhabditis nigoni]|uniref:DUF38 domain-containing protein n=1 Tax=Caenorhabditis nigoni TaxID=1611254 RepID=A0A2G5TZR2_9PELO|nr:hypothetical protein B9Z55_012877 [Caenorhabditis nigoni]